MAFEMQLPFTARGRAGVVNVTVSENADPERFGSVPAAVGFPVCRATVEYDAEGYLAMLGWVQNVGEASPSDRPLVFELDPFVIFDGIETPYAMYGARPELFDAPYRSDRSLSLRWVAHSFLCFAPSSPFAREVEAVIGFRWGFTMGGGSVDLVAPAPLSQADWAAQLELLATSYPAWSFSAATAW